MTRYFDLRPVGAEVFTEAPHVDVRVMDLAAPAADVWAGLTCERPLTWCRRLTDVHYTSPLPGQVGTTRALGVLGGVLKLKEYFFRWDDAAMQHSFHVTHASVPLFEYFAEDYLVEPTSTGCRFTWTFALKARRGLSLPVALNHPVTRTLLYDGFRRDTLAHFGTAGQ